MTKLSLAVAAFLFVFSVSAARAEMSSVPERALGKADAPITVVEYSSLTCSHCADFYERTLPEIEKKYIQTGKVRFIYRDFPTDGISLRASALARCMPANQFFPFIGLLYKNMGVWLRGDNYEDVLLQYAQLGGLDKISGKACMNNEKLLSALAAVRNEGASKDKIMATPTFIINGGQAKILGAQEMRSFDETFEKILSAKK